MTEGLPLSDRDRAPWLEALAQLIRELDQKARPAVIACSALKESYREALKGHSQNVRFVYLKGNYDLVSTRIQSRREHFMRADMLKSQFEVLEEPGQAVVADIAHEPAAIVRQIRQAFDI
jgi:gluconokinase